MTRAAGESFRWCLWAYAGRCRQRGASTTPHNLLVEGMARADASVVVPIAQMGFIVTAMLGFVFLGEPFTGRKGAGLVAALAALASLASGCALG